MLLGNVGCLGKVLARCQQELIFGSSAAILAVGPVFFAFKERHGALLRRPFEDHQNLRRPSLAFDPLDDGRARQIPAPAPLHHLRHIFDVVRDPALIRYFDFADDVIFHAAPAHLVVAGLQTGAFLSSLRSLPGRWLLRSIPPAFFFSSPLFSNLRNPSASFCSINRYLPRGIPSTVSGPSPMRFSFSTGCISFTSTRRISSFFESRIRTSYQKFAARPRDASGCRTVCIRTPISFPSRSRSGSVSIPFTLT